MLQSLLKEMEKESITTRKMLDRVPSDKFDWKPHEKSMSLRQLATHVAEIPGWVPMILHSSELDFSKGGYKPGEIHSAAELKAYFEKNLEEGRSSLREAGAKDLEEYWTMRDGEQIFIQEPKSDVIRGAFCQVVHHRAQLGVYLRLLNIPIPGSYGPSADEPASN